MNEGWGWGAESRLREGTARAATADGTPARVTMSKRTEPAPYHPAILLLGKRRADAPRRSSGLTRPQVGGGPGDWGAGP